MNSSFSLFAVGAGVIALWNQIRGILFWLWSLAFVRVTIRGECREAIAAYIMRKGKTLNWGARVFSSLPMFVRPLKQWRYVICESTPERPQLVWIDGMLILFQFAGVKDSDWGVAGVTLSGVKGFFNFKELTRKALEFSMQETHVEGQRFRVVVRDVYSVSPPASEDATKKMHSRDSDNDHALLSPLHWQREDLGEPQSEEPFTQYVLNEHAQKILQDFERWLHSEDWCKNRELSIPWRRGALVYGPPGTGKSSLIKAIAQKHDLPLFVYDLGGFSNHSFRVDWKTVLLHRPCVVLFEDFDNVFELEKNKRDDKTSIYGNEPLSFDCGLNTISGVENAEGIYIFVTTNKPELISPALTRPGRLDSKFEMPATTETQRREILRRVLEVDYDEADVMVTEGQTSAQVFDFAVKKALGIYFGEE